jgi:hypothetical protein
MNILPPQDIAGALCWLTTDAFESAGLPVLAVVLCGPAQQELLQHLQEKCRYIDQAGDRILILSLGTGKEAPQYFNPSWRLNPDSELSRRIRDIQGNRGYKMGTSWGSFSDAALRLLNLEPASIHRRRRHHRGLNEPEELSYEEKREQQQERRGILFPRAWIRFVAGG